MTKPAPSQGEPQASAVKSKRAGPGRPSGSAAGTRDRILDVAEALFAESGYDATSIRHIATEANVAIAVVTYHVGSKAELFDAVVERKASVIGNMRSSSLRDALEASDGAPVPIRALVSAYIEPFLRFARTHDAGWQNFAVLMGRLSNSPRGTSVITRFYDEVAQAYVAEFCRSLPNVPPERVVVGFLGMVSTMLFVCARTGRLEAITKDIGAKTTEHASIEHVLDFCVSGMIGLESRPLGSIKRSRHNRSL